MARALLLGLAIGFPIAASPGPIFFLVLRRTVAGGWRSGLVSGLGVATGDATYAALAAFGVAAVTNVLLAERRWISLVGGIGLVIIGVRTILGTPSLTLPTRGREMPAPAGTLPRRATEISGYASMVALTLGNPPTILSFAAVFAGLGSHVSSGWPSALALVLGVMIGSALWWVVLTAIVASVRERLTPRVTRAIALISGLALVAFGALISLQSL
jgi:threonine/homoserine/homoserine lactone efflux protein